MRLLIAGGSGVFGRLLARELLDTTTADLILAARRRDRVEAVSRDLHASDRVRTETLDLASPEALSVVAAGCFAVVCAAGPFQSLPRRLPEAALAADAHWIDLADDPGWVLPLLHDRVLNAAGATAGLAVMPGVSTVPALSGVLVRWCRARLPSATRARITLFIGNRNAKGTGAITSALSAGMAAPRRVSLPIGRRTTYRFASPDAVLLREELGLSAEFRVGFELGAVNRIVVSAARLGNHLGPDGRARLGRLLASVSASLGWYGSRRSCLQVELWDGEGRFLRAACIAEGQRLAILPSVFAVEALVGGRLTQRGVLRPAGWQEPDEWIARLQERGVRVVAQMGSAAPSGSAHQRGSPL